MQPVAIVTIIGTVLTVAALAVYLITVAVILKRVNFQLGTVLAGLWSISNQTEQLGPVITAINSELSDANEALENALHRERGDRGPQPASR
ncbi:MAG: hypothetical protein M3N32_09145 [Actinomycetota bacterium]|nr:hypothetical protein [Actinomycetota bacterium]